MKARHKNDEYGDYMKNYYEKRIRQFNTIAQEFDARQAVDAAINKMMGK